MLIRASIAGALVALCCATTSAITIPAYGQFIGVFVAAFIVVTSLCAVAIHFEHDDGDD